MFHKRPSVIKLIYSRQQLFSNRILRAQFYERGTVKGFVLGLAWCITLNFEESQVKGRECELDELYANIYNFEL